MKMVGKSGEKMFTASIFEEFEEVNHQCAQEKPFLMTVSSYRQITATCLSLTSLPIILNDPLPSHLQFLSSAPAAEKAKRGRPKSKKENIDEKKNKKKNDKEDKSEDSEENSGLSVKKKNDKEDKSKDSVENNGLSGAGADCSEVQFTKEECPVCKAYILMSSPDHVVFFAKHYYKHYPLQTQLIPIFIQTIVKLKQLEGSQFSSCPLEFCQQTLDQDQSFARHVRRRHQFEVLMLHLLMKDIKFLKTSLFKNLLDQCKNEKVRSFIECLFRGKRNGEVQDVNEKDKVMIRPRNGSTFDKGRATDFMKKFFRDNSEDQDCQHFLTSRGEMINMKAHEKLITFIYLVSEDHEESGELLQFALKNIKTVFDDKHRKLRHEVLDIQKNDLDTIYPVISEYRQQCLSLSLDPQNVNKDILVILIQKLLINNNMIKNSKAKNIFLKFISTAQGHPPEENIEKMLNHKIQETNFMCNACSDEFDDALGLLLHLDQHKSEDNLEIVCSECQYVMEDISTKDEEATVKSFYILTNHYLQRFHINNSKNEETLEPVKNVCDICDVDFDENKNIVQHCQEESHLKHRMIIEEYLIYCQVKNIDPVNHREFPEFIFFLRYIHSLSLVIKMPLRDTMNVVARIHVNFSGLLNVNESSDVTDEVINKLSNSEPSKYFCFSCSEGFQDKEECFEHFHQSEECVSVRCVDCKTNVSKNKIEYHFHEEDKDQEMHQENENLEKQSRPAFKYNFKATIPEDFHENVSFNVSVTDIIKTQGAPAARAKNIVDHCVEKRKAESVDYPLSMIRYKKLRRDANVKVSNCNKIRTGDADVAIITRSEALTETDDVDKANEKSNSFEEKIEEDDDIMIDEITDHSVDYKADETDASKADEMEEDTFNDKDNSEDTADLSFEKMIQETEESIENIALFIENSNSVDKETFNKSVENKNVEINMVDVNDNKKSSTVKEEEISINIVEVTSLAGLVKQEEQATTGKQTEESESDGILENLEKILAAPIDAESSSDDLELKKSKTQLKQEKEIVLDPQRSYSPINCDIPMFDIALEPQWQYYLEPQIQFLKRKAEVFNRWKNDINFYFKSGS